jgi:hypothetical protein
MRAHARPGHLVHVALGVVVLAFFALLFLVFVWPIDLPFQRVTAAIAATAQTDGHTVRVTGTTNLPDGSLLDWSIYQESYFGDPPAGQVPVQGGAFAFDAELTMLASGSAEAEVMFSCNYGTVQPETVTDVVGGQCEHLGGDQLYVDSPGDSKQLYVPVTFAVP